MSTFYEDDLYERRGRFCRVAISLVAWLIAGAVWGLHLKEPTMGLLSGFLSFSLAQLLVGDLRFLC